MISPEPEEKLAFQSPPPGSQSPSPNVSSSRDYVIVPGDIFKLSVEGEDNFNKTYTVPSTGLVTFPLLGDLRVDGLTVSQLDQKITELLAKDYLVDPQVVVEMIKSRSRKVNIIGAVRQPGSYELAGEAKVLNTLLSAGGPSSFNSELKILRLSREGPEDKEESTDAVTPIIVNLQKLFAEGDVSQNVPLQDGDVLVVSDLGKSSQGIPGQASSGDPQAIYVLGSVKAPGIYKYNEGDTVLDVILRAGGFTEYASKNGTKIVREIDGKTKTFKVKMEDVMKKGDREKNPPVYPEDMIIVPESFF
jgi:polysaccharide export outer membrane protein